MAYIKRAAEDTVLRVAEMFPVLLVTGPRQVGKRLCCKDWRKYSEVRALNESM